MEKNRKADRARQFLPFNSLRGYYDLVRKVEIIKTDKKVLASDEARILDNKLSLVKRGMLVKVKYYYETGYTELEGMVSNIDLVYKTITIVSKKINIDDIIDISSEAISKEEASIDF